MLNYTQHSIKLCASEQSIVDLSEQVKNKLKEVVVVELRENYSMYNS